jgi:molybdate transport system regulatory protein
MSKTRNAGTAGTGRRDDPDRGPGLRVLLGTVTAMGPGKVALLEAIAEEGSISSAARRMGMSYRRAWRHVEALNQAFRSPLVTTARGGRQGGGASLTAAGREALARYRSMETKAQRLLATDIEAFRALLKPQQTER